MSRYKLTVEYNGTNFVGMQKQANGLSIQQVIEEAIKKFSNQEVTICFAGRTDARVHAIGQVIHFDLEYCDQRKIAGAINHFIKPHLISITKIEIVDESFHARFSAKSRSYVYQIINRRAPLALMREKAWHVIPELDAHKMQDAAQILIGHHDFTSFRSSSCQAKSPKKTISNIEVRKIDEQQIHIFIKAPSFLHNQVRIIVGCLKKVGEGTWNKDKLYRLLKACDRTKAGQTAPACGLYFYQVDYS